jgi:pimeloyl-ACP methyl ester carboxylesterase
VLVGTYRPGRLAASVSCPILFCVCDTDSVAPASAAVKYAATAPKGEVKRYPVGHFDIYVGDPFEQAVADQTEFLIRHLTGDRDAAVATTAPPAEGAQSEWTVR